MHGWVRWQPCVSHSSKARLRVAVVGFGFGFRHRVIGLGLESSSPKHWGLRNFCTWALGINPRSSLLTKQSPQSQIQHSKREISDIKETPSPKM